MNPLLFRPGPLVIGLLVIISLACSFVPGLSAATPTLDVVVLPVPSLIQPVLSGSTTPSASLPPAPATNQQEISILKCQNNPNTGIVPAGTSVVLVWGWATDNESKRNEIISISSFTLTLDGVSQDMSNAVTVLESDTIVFWKLSIGALPPGTHEVSLHPVLSRNFTESSGSFTAGPQPEEVCKLIVED